MTAQQAQARDLGAVRGILIASGPAAAFWLVVAAVVLILTGCGGLSPDEAAQRAWDENLTEQDRQELCDAYAILGPVTVNEMIDTMWSDEPDKMRDAVKRTVLDECGERFQ
jgi:hypothetical protein